MSIPRAVYRFPMFTSGGKMYFALSNMVLDHEDHSGCSPGYEAIRSPPMANGKVIAFRR